MIFGDFCEKNFFDFSSEPRWDQGVENRKIRKLSEIDENHFLGLVLVEKHDFDGFQARKIHPDWVLVVFLKIEFFRLFALETSLSLTRECLESWFWCHWIGERLYYKFYEGFRKLFHLYEDLEHELWTLGV